MLTSDDVTTIMSAARAEAQALGGSPISIAIVDDAGYLLRFERFDDAGPTTAEVAYGKAKAAALTRKPTKELEARVVDRPVFLHFPYPDSILITGGLPILVGEECVGAVGVSGRASAEDEAIARVGIAALAIE
jgi:uncharacterized protein GlcG (DUF336 family)